MKEKRGQQGPKFSVENLALKWDLKRIQRIILVFHQIMSGKLIVVISHSYECIIIYTLELYYKQYSSMYN